jgi:hypothetical protein
MGLSSNFILKNNKIIFLNFFKMNIIGRRIKDNKALCCLNCRYPVLLIGRLVCYLMQKI